MQNADSMIALLHNSVDLYTRPALNIFMDLWASNRMSDTIKLFFAYIEEERISNYRTGSTSSARIEEIKKWEQNNSICALVSGNYHECIKFAYDHGLMYEIDCIIYGESYEFLLHESIRKFLLDCPQEYVDEFYKVEQRNRILI